MVGVTVPSFKCVPALVERTIIIEGNDLVIDAELPASLVRMLFLQTVTVGLVGYGIGVGAACIGGIAFSKVGLAFFMSWQVATFGALGIVICCGAAAMLGLRRVIKLESAIVFRG